MKKLSIKKLFFTATIVTGIFGLSLLNGLAPKIAGYVDVGLLIVCAFGAIYLMIPG